MMRSREQDGILTSKLQRGIAKSSLASDDINNFDYLLAPRHSLLWKEDQLDLKLPDNASTDEYL